MIFEIIKTVSIIAGVVFQIWLWIKSFDTWYHKGTEDTIERYTCDAVRRCASREKCKRLNVGTVDNKTTVLCKGEIISQTIPDYCGLYEPKENGGFCNGNHD